MKLPPYFKRVFKSIVNLIVLLMITIASVLDFTAIVDLTGGFVFFGLIIFAYMLFMEYWKLKFIEK